MPTATRLSVRSVSFVIPFFNEARSLPSLLDELLAFVGRAEKKWPLVFDLIFVDDGSQDGGREILNAYVAANPATCAMQILRLSRNFGKEIALTAGLSVAKSDAVVLMDSDLQHPVELIDQFLAGWISESCDVVYAYREYKGQRGSWSNGLLRRRYYRLMNILGEVEIPRDAGDFRLLSRRAYMAVRAFGERDRLMKGLYSWIGFHQKGIPYTPRERRFGKTKFSSFALWMLALDGITAFSRLPLRLAILAGLFLAFLTAGYGVWTIGEKYIYGIQPTGYPTLVVAITFIGAVQLVFLGVIGEYVGRIFVEVKQRPLFLVESNELANPNPPSPRDPM